MRHLNIFRAILIAVITFGISLFAASCNSVPSAGERGIRADISSKSSLPLLCMEAIALVPLRHRGRRGVRGAIYARYSTRFQHSIEDQLRVCRAWAEANNIELDDQFIFIDQARTGKTHRRVGLQNLLSAIGRDEVDVVITFATNRLYRKMYRSLQFIDEEIVSRRKRCVFVSQNIDTTKSEFWRQLITVFGMLDELQLQAQAAFVRAAHEGLLNREMVHGTITFGYRGQTIIEGGKTKLGRERRRLEIDEETAKWVRQVFHWFAVDHLSISAIKRLLRGQNAPLPPKCHSGRWTRLAVRLLLSNRRYIGDFSYGWKNAVWQAKQGYTRQYPREQPRMEKWIERLRIIDTAQFNAVQDRLARYRGRGGRRRKSISDEMPPDILKDLLYCEQHNRFLTANSRFLQCRRCQDERADGQLYSQVNRKLALQLLCERIAELMQADSAFVQLIKQRITEEALKLQAPDPAVLKDLDAEHSSLSRKISFLLDAPAESEHDQREQYERLRDLQRQRATIQERREQLRKATQTSMQAPTDEQIEQEIRRIGAVLNSAGQGSMDPKLVSDARQIIEMVTDGRIVMSQAGEAQAQRGWLRGTFRPQLLVPFLIAAGREAHASVCTAANTAITIDFREPPEIDALSEQVKTLADTGLMMAEIAQQLNLHRNRVTKAFRHWFQSRGQPIPDGRARRSTLIKKHLVAPMYQCIADDVMRLVDQGLKLYEVAQQLGVDRNTVTQSVKWWHRQHGVPLPPGKGRRQEAPTDGIPPTDEDRSAA